MYFMQELPTNKANFILKNMQDFNQTTHVVPQEHNVFTGNISLYFYAIISIKKFNEKVTQWYVMAISTWSENVEVEYALQNAKCVLFNTVFFDLDCTIVSKWRKMETYKVFLFILSSILKFYAKLSYNI